jgi:hypothetical protein
MNNQLRHVIRRAIIHRSIYTRSNFKVGESETDKMTFDPCLPITAAIFVTSLFLSRIQTRTLQPAITPTWCHNFRLPTTRPYDIKVTIKNGEAYSRSSNQQHFQYLHCMCKTVHPKASQRDKSWARQIRSTNLHPLCLKQIHIYP